MTSWPISNPASAPRKVPDPRRLSNVGGWREGDPPAWRQFIDVGSVALEFGGSLPNVKVAYETLGTPRYEHGEIVNAVLVLHALTGDAHISGDPAPGQPTAGWWRALIGPGRAVDTDRWFVVSSNVLGGCQGTTGPSSLAPDGHAWGSRFPEITIRDQVAVEVRLADRLGVRKWASVLGGSMGGMRALEWLVGQPDRVASGFILATGAAASADQIGTQTTQIAAITGDPEWHGGDYYDAGDGPITGLGLARRIAHLTYRTGEELEQRFGRQRQDDRAEVFAVQSYLDHHASKLARRFDAGSYVTLTQAMNTHDVGRGRGGVRSALESIRCPVIVAGIESDRLYPLAQQAEIADATPGCAALDVIISPYGHDAFLIEAEAVGGLLGKLL
ncbi:MAG: homoserine O-acetyltransferase [Frankiales bacterium]|nr:homoserine O-acetyltransferase [Frankiales bacterium]